MSTVRFQFSLNTFYLFRGGVKFSTGGESPRASGLNRCNSGTDGIVRMKESENKCDLAVLRAYLRPCTAICACRGFLFPHN